MPPKSALSSVMGWRCPQCSLRTFSTYARQLAVGPEHPRYIEIPEPPQQTLPGRPPVKGVLPVPRNVFAGTDRTKTDDEMIAESIPEPRHTKRPAKGSREEWKAKMSEMRRQNLREGVKSLRARQQYEAQRLAERSEGTRLDREERLNRPEREDERLTAPSNNLDLDALLNKPIPDPSRERRIEQKKKNLLRHQESKRRERTENLHTLYMNARDFIVTPEQLDKAVDKAFGTTERPYSFGTSLGGNDWSTGAPARSIWAEGKPASVQDMLNRTQGGRPRYAMDDAGKNTDINKERIRRIAETLTGGKM